MAVECHRITKTDGAFFNESPWHKLGHIKKGVMSAVEAARLGGILFDVEKTELYYYWNDTNPKMVKDKFIIVRNDTGEQLGVVGKNYQIFQNKEMAELADEILGGTCEIQSAFTMMGGIRTVILAEMPGDIKIKGKDTLKKHLFLTSTHDGSGNFVISPTATRVVCWNTYSAAMRMRGKGREAAGITIRHSKSMGDRIEEAKVAMLETRKQFEKRGEEMRAMANKPVKKEEVKEFYQDLLSQVLSQSTEDQEQFKEESQKVYQNGNLLDMVIEESSKKLSIAEKILLKNNGRAGSVDGKSIQQRRFDNALATVLDYYENDPKQTENGIGGTAWAALNGFTQWIDHDSKYNGNEMTRLEQRLMQTSLPGGRGFKIKEEAYKKALAMV